MFVDRTRQAFAPRMPQARRCARRLEQKSVSLSTDNDGIGANSPVTRKNARSKPIQVGPVSILLELACDNL
jgi:hypothetical protein